MARVLLFGGAWIGVLAALGFTLGVPAFSPPTRAGAPATAAHARPRAPVPRAGAQYPGWTVTKATSAHHMMVVEVAAERTAHAKQIAAQVVEPVKDRYEEILVYIRARGQNADALPARRIQWTARSGYVESIYSAER